MRKAVQYEPEGPRHRLSTIHPTDGEKREWSRAAQWFYDQGHSPMGHILSAAATRSVVTVQEYDRIATIYRRWLIGS